MLTSDNNSRHKDEQSTPVLVPKHIPPAHMPHVPVMLPLVYCVSRCEGQLWVRCSAFHHDWFLETPGKVTSSASTGGPPLSLRCRGDPARESRDVIGSCDDTQGRVTCTRGKSNVCLLFYLLCFVMN
jgi:hypothetical protein